MQYDERKDSSIPIVSQWSLCLYSNLVLMPWANQAPVIIRQMLLAQALPQCHLVVRPPKPQCYGSAFLINSTSPVTQITYQSNSWLSGLVSHSTDLFDWTEYIDKLPQDNFNTGPLPARTLSVSPKPQKPNVKDLLPPCIYHIFRSKKQMNGGQGVNTLSPTV